MDSDQGKVFVGGISWDTTEETLKDFFKVYGEVADAVIMRDRMTGRARGFGFVGFADPAVVDRVLQEKHNINGRTVEVKRAVPRDEQQSAHLQRGGNTAGPRTKKIFVGGLASNVAEDDFRMYFEQFGKITDVVVMYDHATQRHRGFGFITFDSEDAVEKVLHKGFHELKDKMVEVKRAIPKESFQGTSRAPYGQAQRSFPGGGGGGSFGARPDGRYGHSAPAGRAGGYPSYGAPVPAYGAAGYGSTAAYGAGVNGGYGVAPGYGAAPGYAGGAWNAPANGAYGGGAAGYGGGYGGAPMAAKTGWAAGAAGSTGYGAGGGGYWGGGAQAQAAAVPAANYGYGSSGYEAPAGGGYGVAAAGVGSGAGAGGGGYSGGYGDMYSNSGYGGAYNATSGENA